MRDVIERRHRCRFSLDPRTFVRFSIPPSLSSFGSSELGRHLVGAGRQRSRCGDARRRGAARGALCLPPASLSPSNPITAPFDYTSCPYLIYISQPPTRECSEETTNGGDADSSRRETASPARIVVAVPSPTTTPTKANRSLSRELGPTIHVDGCP